MKISLLLWITMVFTFESFAQNFSSGYILPSGMDTIHGFVLNETDRLLAKGIVFRNSINGAQHTYYPKDLSAWIRYRKTFSASISL